MSSKIKKKEKKMTWAQTGKTAPSICRSFEVATLKLSLKWNN